ncbi:hypothetical protein WMY93_014833 [Mugilogobius chulae]|uniref:Uncharacterized protein n=1 Tax=Mugilogobius chulae TaxID=88201 RepID=A0AAW0NWH0_9GOBI
MRPQIVARETTSSNAGSRRPQKSGSEAQTPSIEMKERSSFHLPGTPGEHRAAGGMVSSSDPASFFDWTTTGTPEPSHESYVTPENTLRPSGPSPLLWLLVTPVVVVMTSVLVLVICRKKRAQNDVKLRENSGRSRKETKEYENIRAVSQSADDTYQSLCADTMDPNQIYSSI